MRPWTIPIALVACGLGAGAARADQCAWLDDAAVATRAARELERHRSMISFCEPCGELAPGAPVEAAEVAVRPVDGGAVEVTVDGRGIDLAYTYVKTSEHQYRNLASLAGCPASGVSPHLRIDQASTGVLISADSAAPVHAVAVAPAPSAVLPPAPATVVYIVAPPGWGAGWIGILLACGAGLAGVIAALGRVGARRRRAMLPRAVDLAPPEG
jgi:hypothetical protein